MKSMLLYLFPGLLRLERKKQDFEKYMPLILLAALVVYTLMALFVYPPKSLWRDVWMGIQKTAMLYFTYLIMLELAPDAKNIYLWSIGVIALTLLLPVTSTLMFSTLFFLFMIRILTKSSGYLTTRWELGLMTFFMIMEFFFSPFIYPLVFGVALLLDYKYKHKDSRNLPFAAFSLLLSLLWINNGFGIMIQNLDPLGSITIFVISLLYIFRLSILKTILSFNDIGNNIISPKRVKSAGILLLLSLMIMAIGHGLLYEYAHLWGMLGCISVPYLRDVKKLFLKEV